MATRTRPPAQPAVHAGPCGAVHRYGHCTCPGYEPGGQVAGYQQCVCGHTQPSHALVEPVPPGSTRAT